MEYGNKEILKPNEKILNIWIGPGLPCTTNPNINKATTSVKQLYNMVKNNYPLLSSTLQSNPNRSIQKTIQPAITEQNQILDHKINHMISSNVNISERPTFQPLVKKVNSSNTLYTSMQTREKKQVIKQPRKREYNNVPLMGIFTNVKDVPRAGNNIQSRVIPGNKPRPQKPAVPQLPKAKALYDYIPQDHDEIRLKEGDIVEILKEHEGGWWYGRLTGKTGLFPSNYVVKI